MMILTHPVPFNSIEVDIYFFQSGDLTPPPILNPSRRRGPSRWTTYSQTLTAYSIPRTLAHLWGALIFVCLFFSLK